jgi:hypothetical protein
MNRSMQLARLDQAERHIASGIRYIERQEQLIAGLGRDGATSPLHWTCLRPFATFKMKTLRTATALKS